jgi:putative heme-binding domain-containing protein
VLSERSADGNLSEAAAQQLSVVALTNPKPARRLRALWALHAIDGIDDRLAAQLLQDDSEYVRAWTVQLAVESLPATTLPRLLEPLARQESSLLVRRYLASAIPRVEPGLGWMLAETLAGQPENSVDQELLQLTWYGVAGLLPADIERAFELAASSEIASLRDSVSWYAAKLSPRGRDAMISRLAGADSDDRTRLLSLLELGLRGMRGLPQSGNWSEISSRLYDAPDGRVRRAAESVGAAFGDQELYLRMRRRLSDDASSVDAKRHALGVLASDAAEQNLPLLLGLLDNDELVAAVLPLLTRYNDQRTASELIARLPAWQGRVSAAAMEVLSTRSAWAEKVLDAIVAGDLDKAQLTAYHVRQMSGLGDDHLNSRLSQEWGALKQSSAQRQTEIATMADAFSSAPLWAYSAAEGANHFKKLCANCHQPNAQDESLGPKLAGTRSKGIQYIVENVIDPNAVIGRDFQARLVVTDSGRVISGLVEKETDSAITIRTATDSVTVAASEIEQIRISENSFMPEGLLKDLNDRQRIELFKYLMTQ